MYFTHPVLLCYFTITTFPIPVFICLFIKALIISNSFTWTYTRVYTMCVYDCDIYREGNYLDNYLDKIFNNLLELVRSFCCQEHKLSIT